jgi:hypothetical protein
MQLYARCMQNVWSKCSSADLLHTFAAYSLTLLGVQKICTKCMHKVCTCRHSTHSFSLHSWVCNKSAQSSFSCTRDWNSDQSYLNRTVFEAFFSNNHYHWAVRVCRANLEWCLIRSKPVYMNLKMPTSIQVSFVWYVHAFHSTSSQDMQSQSTFFK